MVAGKQLPGGFMSLITNNLDISKEIEDFDFDNFEDDEMTLGGQFSKSWEELTFADNFFDSFI